MANRLFRNYVQRAMTTGAPNLATADLRVVLVDVADHDPNTGIAGDDFLNDIPSGARVATTLALQNVTVVDGVLDADDVALPDTGGDQAEELVIYQHTGTESTSLLIACIDTATGLPISRDSVEDEIQWHASGILAL